MPDVVIACGHPSPFRDQTSCYGSGSGSFFRALMRRGPGSLAQVHNCITISHSDFAKTHKIFTLMERQKPIKSPCFPIHKTHLCPAE